MPELPHLILPRAQVDMDRRKPPGFGSQPARNFKEQTLKVSRAVDEALASHKALTPTVVDPALIVRVRTANVLPEEEWTRAGLIVLGNEENKSVVLFASDAELTAFRERLAAYSRGIPEGWKNPQYASLIAAIEEFGPLSPSDRIGSVLRSEGFEIPESFSATSFFRLDAELWEVGTQAERMAQVERVEAGIQEHGGTLTDQYIGTSFTALRVAGTGITFRWLLALPMVRVIDRPPAVDSEVEHLLETSLEGLGNVAEPLPNSPSIAILDTGINDAHPVLVKLVSEKVGFPPTLGVSDIRGHGTKVSGVAAYGDVRNCVETQYFAPQVHLFSGKVVNDQGNFDDEKLVSSQMDAVIRHFHSQGCRIFNLSIGNSNARYAGGKVGTWTAILDELARELDVLIVVASGNYRHDPTDGRAENHLLSYPGYLLESQSRLFEPSVGANVIAVGAVAHAAAVPDIGSGTVGLRPIAGIGEPAPFTRCGPGIQNAIKPDLCDDAGNILFDGVLQRTSRYSECEVLTTHPQYLDRLFTSVIGSSYAAPLVAHKAALVLQALRALHPARPDASANLLRALLASSAKVPEAAVRRLQRYGDEAIRNLCGYGIPNATLAATSDANRVVLYADDIIGMDRFFVYEVPVPREFSKTSGQRAIRVTLAFDPPTRQTRVDYLGVKMSFRLVRGKSLGEVIDHYKKRVKEIDGEPPELESKYNCGFDTGPRIRECGTLQTDTFKMSRNLDPTYGETYHLVVRCERKWAGDFVQQRFSLVVELSHEADIQLYERVRERVQVRVRA